MTSNKTLTACLHRSWSARQLRDRLGSLLLLAILLVGALPFLVPFLWMLSTSVKPIDQVYLVPPAWIPREFQWEWYINTWQKHNFPLVYRNTIFICAMNQVGMLLSCSMAAFAFARLRFRWRDPLFVLLLSTMMLPGQVTLIPTYLLFVRLGWVDTFKPMIVPTYFAVSAFTVFLMRQYFMTIPLEIDDAARIDGVGFPGLYWRIILPLSKPVLGVAAIIQFTGDWNDFFTPLLYLSSRKNFTIAAALNMLHNPYLRFDIQAVMAMTVVSIIPLLFLFFMTQKKYVQGIVVTGIKG